LTDDLLQFADKGQQKIRVAAGKLHHAVVEFDT